MSGRHLERVDERIGQPGDDGAHVLHVDGVELADLGEHEGDELLAR